MMTTYAIEKSKKYGCIVWDNTKVCGDDAMAKIGTLEECREWVKQKNIEARSV